MLKKTLLVVGILVAFPLSASAGMLGSITSAVSGGSSSGGSNAVTAGNQLVAKYVAGNVSVLKAQRDMAKALGLKTELAADEATLKSMQSGSVSKHKLNKIDKIIATNSAAIKSQMASKPVLSAASKVEYAKGLGELAAGVIDYVGMKNAAAAFSSSASSLSPMAAAQDASELAAALYVAKSLPSSISNLGSALNEAVSFAKSNKIPVPANATKALGSL
ncbi:hypothetical protein [Candidatus Igneacidithiobacillus taiwanensis]|uniref:hypothetical protein n=1 Tax=Candidatus Igneacidithiobacillus taiwanensis TaxID=1945924 RepID=UPI0028A085AA|nr:hypothetical protein [Candidatus Igneacidithiobacillus taiwanensis]